MALASRALRPVDRMREEVDRIPGHELHRRLRVGRNDELGRLAQAFNRLLARVEAASHEQEQFVADASHELKTPITAIEGHARIVLRAIDRGESDRARESAEVVARQSRRIALTLRELLELAQTGEVPPPTDRVRLDLVAREAANEAQALVPDRSIRASLDPTTVLGDPNRLRELVAVLLDNAIKYSPPDRPVEVALSTPNGRGPLLSVRDYGPGMTAAERASVFARFARGTAAADVPGSGLGLAIARAIAERHGATIALLAADGDGTIAEVQFPAPDPQGSN
jgi:two-component system sensor histidine kinase MprB